METTVLQRIRSIIKFYSLSDRRFAEVINLPQTTISSLFKRGNEPNVSIVQSILNAYTDISPGWLLTGKGSMLKSEQITTVKERLNHFIKEENLNASEFIDSIGMSFPYFSEMKGSMRESQLKAIVEKYPQLNIEWLTTGEGQMFNENQTSNVAQEQDTPANYERKGNTIKYFPSVSGSMGGIEFLDNPDEFYTDIILPGFGECKFAVNAFGDSMYPVIKSGQIVIMMPWVEKFIDWGHIYMVVTKSGYRAIKYLRPSTQEGCVTCESENKENNPAFDIEMEDIHKLYLVKGWICRDAI